MLKVETNVTSSSLDNRLVRAMREGQTALPADLRILRNYLRLIDGLLEEKAAELEPSWSQATSTLAEISTLQSLEQTVAERAIAIEAAGLAQICEKLEIWQTLVLGSEEGDPDSTCNRLVFSVIADLLRHRDAKS